MRAHHGSRGVVKRSLSPGMRRAAREFNKIHDDLAAKGITMTITSAGDKSEGEAEVGKIHATIDTATGEVQPKELDPMFGPDLKRLERQIADAFGELQIRADAKSEATAEHKEAQEKLNALVAELTRIVNGEQRLL
jgi:hypothetical protein